MHLVNLPKRELDCRGSLLDLSQPQVMGILNVTPDSFSDGGRYCQVDAAYSYAMQMIEDGASIIDVGGESTRPGASGVDPDEEIQRIIPVLKKLAKENVIISIDTSQPEVIRAAVEEGAHIWNDVRGLRSANALETAIDLDIPVIVMHMRGDPKTMDQLNQYTQVIDDVLSELNHHLQNLIASGLNSKNIIIDPGFGFAKNTEQNLSILSKFWRFGELGYPILAGLSRKRFIGEALGGRGIEERVIGSTVGHLLSIQQGASIVRVHDVRETVDAIRLWKALTNQ